MEKDIVVTIGTNCKEKRDNNLGLYCRLGSRRLKRVKKRGKKEVIVCLNCDEPGKPTLALKRKKES